jgi:uncharacterized protein
MSAGRFTIKAFLRERLPEHLDGRDDLAYNLVRKAMVQIYGRDKEGWEAIRNPAGKMYVRAKR